MARPIAGWLVAAMFGLAACGGNGSAEPSTTTVARSSTTSSTTTSTSTTTTTSLVPTTTISPLDAEKAKVEAAYRAVDAAFTNALTVLDGYDPASLRQVFAPGPLLDGELQFVADFRAQGRRVRPNNPDTTRNVVESNSLNSSQATTASLVVCESDNAVVYEPGRSPGPEDDVIIDDGQSARRVQWGMVKEGGAWLAEHHTTLGTWPGASECPAS